jgi:hypothetical protein
MDLPDSGRRSLALLGHDGLTAYRAQGGKLPRKQIPNRYASTLFKLKRRLSKNLHLKSLIFGFDYKFMEAFLDESKMAF